MKWEDVSLVIDEALSERVPCDCCRKTTVTAGGDLSYKEKFVGWYTVGFSEECSEAEPIITVYVGDWSDGAHCSQRWAARTIWREDGCMLLDWDKAGIDRFTPLDREDVLGTDFATEFWALVDTVIMKDPRVEHIYA